MQERIAIAVRTDFERTHWVHPMLAMWCIGIHAEKTHQLVVTIVHGAGGYAASSNASAYDFMDNHPDYEWLCMIDNDTVPPDDILRMLDDIPQNVDIISPLTYMMRADVRSPMQGFYTDDRQNVFVPISLDGEQGRIKVDRAGGGCCFYRRRVFEAMERPYFMVMFDKITQLMVISDDAYCQNIARKKGFLMVCDTRFVARHYHTVDLSA